MSVHYKFKSNLDYNTVTFDGLHISVSDLKKAIIQQKKIKKGDFDLEITNAQLDQVYTSEDDLIPKNTSVIVRRMPLASGSKKIRERPELPLPPDDNKPSGSIRYDRSIKKADLANSYKTEDDKVKAMINQSSQEYDPSRYVKSRSMTGPLPPTYTCYRCGKQGHWIKNCPTNNPDVKRSTGIPRSFMVHVDGPEHKGALLTSSGEFAVPIIDQQAYKEVKKEKPPFVPEPITAAEPAEKIPEELLCMICKNLVQDAVLTPCCANCFCDDCIRQSLIESSSNECPVCHETGVLPNTVIPSRYTRQAVARHNGYTEVKRVFQTTRPTPVPKISSPQLSPDSTVDSTAVNSIDCQTEIIFDTPVDIYDLSIKMEPPDVEIKEEETGTGIPEESIELTQPGTPLADELEEDVTHPLPIQTSNQTQYDDYYPGSYSNRRIEGYEQDSGDSSDQRPISVIDFTTNFRKTKFPGRLPPMMSHQNYSSNYHKHEYSDYETRERSDYPSRYDNRNGDRTLSGRTALRSHSRYERQPHDTRYHHHSESRYHNHKTNHAKGYNLHPTVVQSRQRFHYPSTNLSVPPPYIPDSIGSYSQPAPVPAAIHLLPSHPTLPSQPPPPGASPSDTLSHIPPQPPPPGVGPLLPTPPLSQKSELSTFTTQIFNAKGNNGQPEEKSIDDRIEAFQRELQKRDRESVRERSRSSSRSRTRNRSRSTSRSSHSRSYNSSKSWTCSVSRSVSRSRSRSYISRQSRSRSFSRSHSRSKSRSLSRLRTHSRSRSRSRERRRSCSRERPSDPYSRSHSASHSPRNFHTKVIPPPYPSRRNANPPSYIGSYATQYTVPSTLPMPTPYPPVHIQSIHTIQPPPFTHPISHYPPDHQYYRNSESYGGYNAYDQQSKPHINSRFEREHRNQRFENRNYNKREESPHGIPGWVGDRNRQDRKFQHRVPRDQRKEIRELPQVSEEQVLSLRTQKSEVRMRESRDANVSKKKDEKPQVTKCKKHHRIKEVIKSEKTDSKAAYEDKIEVSQGIPNLIKIEVQPSKEITSKISTAEKRAKSLEKKERRQKHKKQKLLADGGKKIKVHKKEKVNDEAATENIKIKKKKKLKATGKCKEEKAKSADRNIPDEISEPLGENIGVVLRGQNDESEHQLQVSYDSQIRDIDQEAEPGMIDQEMEPDMIDQETEPDMIDQETEPDMIDQETEQDTIDQEMDPDMIDQETEPNMNDQEAEPEMIDQEVEQEMIDQVAEPEMIGAPDQAKILTGNVMKDSLEFEINNEVMLPQDISMDKPEENEDEEEIEEDVLRVDIPELSKWEREEYEDDRLSKPWRKNTMYKAKKIKDDLPSDIIQRAEKVILQKPLKTAIVAPLTKEKRPQRMERVSVRLENANNVSSGHTIKLKVHEEVKPISSKKSVEPTLQVTISTDKEKRSVQTKNNARKKETKGSSFKRVKLDRSHFSCVMIASTKPAENSCRTVLVEHSLSELKRHTDKQSTNSERVRSHSSGTKSREKISYSRKDEHTHSSDYSQNTCHQSGNYVVEEIRLRESYESQRQTDRYERNKHNSFDQGSSGERCYLEPTVTFQKEERKNARYRKSRSRSSSESYGRKQQSRKPIEPHYDSSNKRMKEDNYQKNSIGHRVSKQESEMKRKRPIEAPENNRKHQKYNEVDKIVSSSSGDKNRFQIKESSMPSSMTTSSPSDSESSEMERKISRSKVSEADHKQKHKKSHKKHKKHKHKHKRKKSHKSKQKD